MQVLRQKEKKKYRDCPDFFDLLKKEIGLPRVPHFTTANKFTLRVKPAWFEQLIAQIIKSIESQEAAIDGTSFSLNTASSYYETISGKRKEFMQFNSCIELRHKLITAVKIRRKRRNENIDFKPLVRKTSKQLSINLYLADKAYDSEKNHEVCEKHGARFIAPLRESKRGWKIKGFHRRQMKQFPDEIYKKRLGIESGFSALKRKYGDIVYAKRFVSQKNELLCRVLAYNIEKVVNLFIIEIYFLQDLKSLYLLLKQKQEASHRTNH